MIWCELNRLWSCTSAQKDEVVPTSALRAHFNVPVHFGTRGSEVAIAINITIAFGSNDMAMATKDNHTKRDTRGGTRSGRSRACRCL